MLALIVGAGRLPAVLVSELEQKPKVCALSGFEPDGLDVDISFRLEHLGSVLASLKEAGIDEICLAGSIRRPQIDPAEIDAATLPLIPILQQALTQGDDGALRAVISVFEQSGFSVRAAHEIAPGLLPEQGFLTKSEAEPQARSDAERAEEIVAAMSAADVGQCCVVEAGQALAIESVFGTDWMLKSLLSRPSVSKGGILFKAPKPDQDLRVDMPTIGIETVHAAVAAGLKGIVIETGGVLVLDRQQVIARCDEAGIFLWVRNRSD